MNVHSGLGAKEMLKSYTVEDLREGMKVGRDIMDADTSILIGAGTVLTNQMIYSLLERPIFFVYIEESDEDVLVEIPGKEFLLDDEYVGSYERAYQRVQRIYQQLYKNEVLELQEIEDILSPKNVEELCNGAKAVSQIHNMSRDGSYVIHHALHVMILAGLMCRWMSWPKERAHDLMMSAVLHDVGKMKVPSEILDKRDSLTPEEFSTVKKHAEYGYNMLKLGPIGSKRDVLFGILQHHERCDGSGYPNAVRKDQIDEFARIIGILDIYDAMATDRIYARRSSPFDVLGVLYEDVLNGKLDTEYGVLFMKNICHALNGNWVRLSDGQKARIVYIDESRVTSLPVVQTIKDEFIDLNRRKDIKVESILTARELE